MLRFSRAITVGGRTVFSSLKRQQPAIRSIVSVPRAGFSLNTKKNNVLFLNNEVERKMTARYFSSSAAAAAVDDAALAEKGDAAAQLRQFKKTGEPKWLQSSFEQKYPPAFTVLGSLMFENGDKDEAIRLWKEADSLGEPVARLLLAKVIMGSTNEGSPEFQTAVDYLEKLSKKENVLHEHLLWESETSMIDFPWVEAHVLLGILQINKANVEKGLEMIRKVANFGPRYAFYTVQMLMAYPKCPVDLKELHSLLCFAESEMDEAGVFVAMNLLYGNGVEKDTQAAVNKLKALCGKGDNIARISLGRMLVMGLEGIEKNVDEGLAYLKAASDTEDEPGITNYAVTLFDLGRKEEAVELARKGAALEYASSTYYLANMLGALNDSKPNEEIIQLMEKAAQLGSEQAQQFLEQIRQHQPDEGQCSHPDHGKHGHTHSHGHKH